MKRETIDLFNRIFKVLEPPPDLTLSQWADRYRRLSSESGSKGGKWNTEKAPWQREIMDAITDISVEKVVVMSAAQMGKTDAFLLNTIGYYMHYDPCTILCMQPTLSLAETMSKDRLMPMVRDTPALRDKINEKSRTAGNTIFKKAFPGGRITMSGANSPTELRSRPIRILLADEIDAYPPTAGAEGDPLILAGKRLTTYWNRKEVDTSTPTIKGASRIEEMQVDQEDENSIELAPGAVIDLGEGEKANMVNPGRPNPNFDPFVIAVLKQIGAALEIPYEILIMAFSSNYSASRAAILEFFKVVKMYRAWFVADFCQPIYEEWLSEAVAKGRIKAPGFFTDPIIKDAYCSAEWTGPSAGQLDPTKEVEAAEKRVQGGYSTREREARELTGTDFYKNIKQRKREEELLKEVTGGAKTDTQTVENINGREESDTENNPDNDGGQTEEETEE